MIRNSIYDPAKLPSFASIGMNPVMARPTKCRKKFPFGKQVSMALGLVVNVLAFIGLASLASGMEGKIRFLYFCILAVLALSLFGCGLQPAFTH